MIIRELLTRLGYEIDDRKLMQYEQAINTTQQRLQGFGLKMSAALTVPITAIATKSLMMANSFEQSNIALEVMLGSAEKGKKMMADLMAFTLKTPFQFQQVREGSQMLIAMGIKAEDVIGAFTMLGNVAAGTGIPLSRLAYNYGQIKSMGRAFAIDLKQFAMAGVPIYDELAKVTGKNREEIIKMGSTGQITFELVEQAFKNMNSAGGRYFNMMEKQAKTLGGQFSNLQDSLSFLSASFGSMIERNLKLRTIMSKVADLLKVVDKALRELSPSGQKFLIFLGLALALIGPMSLGIAGLIGVLKMLGGVMATVTTAFRVGSLAAFGFNFAALVIPAAIAAAIVAVALFIEDLWGWMHGQDSVLKHLIGSWDDFQKKIERAIGKETLDEIKLFAKTVGIMLQDIGSDMEGFWNLPSVVGFRELMGLIGKGIKLGAKGYLQDVGKISRGEANYQKVGAKLDELFNKGTPELLMDLGNWLNERMAPTYTTPASAFGSVAPAPAGASSNTFNFNGYTSQDVIDTINTETGKQHNELIRSKK